MTKFDLKCLSHLQKSIFQQFLSFFCCSVSSKRQRSNMFVENIILSI